MKAAVFYEYGDVDVLQIADVPKPTIAEDEVLVQVISAAVNPKDTFIRKGRFKRFTGKHFPQLTGFDFAGRVAESNSAEFAVGDAVFGMLDGWHGGTCTEYVAVQSTQLAHKPESITFDDAASMPLVALTALQALRDDGEIQAGNRVCINGASGGVGTMAIQIAKIYDCHVTAIASEKNHEMLYHLGADECIDYRKTDIIKTEMQFDIFFDVFGNTRYRDIKAILTVEGRWISTVLQAHVFISTILSHFSRKSAKLVVVKANCQDLLTIGEWMSKDQLKAVIAQTFSLYNMKDAHLLQQSKHSGGKIVIKV